MKNLFRLIAVILMTVAIGGVFGCTLGGDLPSDTSSGSGEELDSGMIHPDENATLTLTVAMPSGNSEETAIKKVIEVFNKTYKNITVKSIPMGASVSQFIQTAYATDSLPDIFMLSQFDMIKLDALGGVLKNLQPYINAEEKEKTFNSDDYVKAYWELGQKDFGGDQMMIPRTMDRVVCHYNKKIFKAAGVNMDLVKNGWTWDDFKTVAATLRAYYDGTLKDTHPLADSNFNWEAMINPVFEAYGVQYFDDNGKITIDSSATKNGLNFFKDMYDKKYFSGPQGGGADFDNLKGCMAFDSQALTYHMNRMKENLPTGENIEDVYDVVTMPVFSGKEKIGAGAAGYAVSATSKNANYAWKFLKTICSTDGQNAIADGGLTQASIRKDMSEISANNHWTVGFENYNLAAYTYKNGSVEGEKAWDCYTSFFLKVNHNAATDIIAQDLLALVNSYLSGKTYEAVIKNYTSSVKNHIQMAELG